MKKFLVVLLSLGLIVAFGATASAADVKFSGSYYVLGFYADNQKLSGADKGNSSAAFWQRFRVQPVFVVAEGLSLTARWDAMEKGWGNTNWKGGVDEMNLSRRATPRGGTPNAQENFEWERGYMTFATKIGQFDIGYQSSGKWGTDAFDDEKTRPRIKFATKAGPMTLLFIYEKQFESVYANSTAYPTQAGKVDMDNENYNLAGIYSFKGGDAGLLYQYTRNASNRGLTILTTAHKLIPYVKATFGPVFVEGELAYVNGVARKYESPNTTADQKWSALGFYIHARANVGPAYFGTRVLYTPGDDTNDATKKTDFVNASGNGSQDLDFGLILGNDSYQTPKANGGVGGANTTTAFDSSKFNSWFYGVYGGINATPKLNIEVLFTMAQLDKDAWVNINYPETNTYTKGNVSKNLGMEIDVVAKYKIYDNLTYLVGAGYLFTGDAFKGTDSNNKIGNDFMLLNKLTLNF